MSPVGNKIAVLRGMADIFPPETVAWQKVEAVARQIFARAGFLEIRTPIVEPAELFIRSIGETTAIVEKEMYLFPDRDGDRLVLRPEGTAPVVRAYVAAGIASTEPISRLWYAGPMFRYERPQKGRSREFHQIGLELFGSSAPEADAEVMTLTAHFLDALGVTGVKLEVNSIGCLTCRAPYHERLVAFLAKHVTDLCDDCRRRMKKNPLRVFDCKQEGCRTILKSAPRISEYRCAACGDHFGRTRKALTALGTDFVVNENIVRGLDYYMRTAFEFTSDQLGAQNAVAAGGRYDGLVRDLGGPDIPGVGVALGIERLVLLLPEGVASPASFQPKVFVASLSAAAQEKMLPGIALLRRDGVHVEWDYEPKSLKSLLRRADKIGATSVIIVGDDEVAKGQVIVRDMKTKEQREVSLDMLPRFFVRVDR